MVVFLLDEEAVLNVDLDAPKRSVGAGAMSRSRAYGCSLVKDLIVARAALSTLVLLSYCCCVVASCPWGRCLLIMTPSMNSACHGSEEGPGWAELAARAGHRRVASGEWRGSEPVIGLFEPDVSDGASPHGCTVPAVMGNFVWRMVWRKEVVDRGVRSSS